MVNQTLALLFALATQSNHLPIGLLSSLCFVESSHNVHAMHRDDGGGNSVGICQIKLNTARLLGFKGTENDLKNPKVNVQFAGLYLHRQLTRYHGDTPRAVSAYNAGSYRPGKQTFARNQRYVEKVFKAWGEGR